MHYKLHCMGNLKLKSQQTPVAFIQKGIVVAGQSGSTYQSANVKLQVPSVLFLLKHGNVTQLGTPNRQKFALLGKTKRKRLLNRTLLLHRKKDSPMY